MNKNRNFPSIENQKNIESNKLVQIGIENESKKFPILKMLHIIHVNQSNIKIFGKDFVFRNKNKSRVILNHKIYDLSEKIQFRDKKDSFQIKIKLYDNFLRLDSIFAGSF